jgi:hypothetical protein
MSEEKQQIDNPQIKKEENIEKTYDIEGLLIGGAIGLAVGILISFMLFLLCK